MVIFLSIYLDNAATTPLCPEAIREMTRILSEQYGNPSSIYAPGREALALLDAYRQTVAEALGARPEEITFTSGGTEANNWAIRAAVHKLRRRGKHIVSTAIEHDSVRQTLAEMGQSGFEVTLVGPSKDGAVSVEDVCQAVRPDTVLVSVMLVNNETGVLQPVSEIAGALRASGSEALIHTDAVQAFMEIPFSPKELGIDLLSVSAHKIHGPKGVGALWKTPGLRLSPLLFGGQQEHGRRAGTEALHNIAGFAAAVTAAEAADAGAHLRRLQAVLRETLKDVLPDASVLPMGAPQIASVSLPGCRSEVLMNDLDAQGIYISRSSACKKGGRSHVLEAMRLPPAVIDGTIRVGFSRMNTEEEVRVFVLRLQETKMRLFPG